MEYLQLGNTSLKVSRIGFGCMSLKIDRVGNEALLREAFDNGINYFDTADLYDKGKNEETIGRAFKGMREKLIIASKAGNQWRADGSGWDWNPAKDYILKCADDSLRRLQTDYIDLFQLHGGTMEDPIDETIEAFEILKKQGKIRYYGISSIRPVVIREWTKRSSIESVMIQYSLLDRRPEESILDFLKENSKSVLVRGSLAQGMLSGKAAQTYLGHTIETVESVQEQVNALNKKSQNPVFVPVRYVLDHPAVTSAVVGIGNTKQLKDALGVFDESLTGSGILALRNAVPALHYTQHR